MQQVSGQLPPPPPLVLAMVGKQNVMPPPHTHTVDGSDSEPVDFIDSSVNGEEEEEASAVPAGGPESGPQEVSVSPLRVGCARAKAPCGAGPVPGRQACCIPSGVAFLDGSGARAPGLLGCAGQGLCGGTPADSSPPLPCASLPGPAEGQEGAPPQSRSCCSRAGADQQVGSVPPPTPTFRLVHCKGASRVKPVRAPEPPLCSALLQRCPSAAYGPCRGWCSGLRGGLVCSLGRVPHMGLWRGLGVRLGWAGVGACSPL